MRIVLDLQACQSRGNSIRGIGRYSMALAKALARHAQGHELIIALNEAGDTSTAEIAGEFDGLIPRDRIVTWSLPRSVLERQSENRWRARAGELAREHFLALLEPDIVHVASLFEGFHNDAVSSVGLLENGPATAVTLYDLIPAIYPETYLPTQEVRDWYHRKLRHLRKAELCLSISEHSRREAMDLLGLSPDRIVTVMAAADPMFRPTEIENADEVRRKYRLSRGFVMYSGGVDRRKNLDRLIRAFAGLPPELRQRHQLAIVGALDERQTYELRSVAAKAGLETDEIVLPGFVPDSDLVELYNLCTLFIMPSLHEGFGLPVLEAMKCGAAVICSNTTSLPEVMGCADATFDPHSVGSITSAMHRALTDEAYRTGLKRHGLSRSKTFNWDDCAKRALDAFEDLHARTAGPTRSSAGGRPTGRPSLAYVPSPRLADAGAIRNHRAGILPELSDHYEIDLILPEAGAVDPLSVPYLNIRSMSWLLENGGSFDRILYELDGAPADNRIFDLLDRWPGTVLLDDFFLGAAMYRMETVEGRSEAWQGELYASHGYGALIEAIAARPDALIGRYPCNGTVIERAMGIIVHSEGIRRLAREWYGDATAARWVKVAPPLGTAGDPGREEARRRLGLGPTDLVACFPGVTGRASLDAVLGALEAPGDEKRKWELFVPGKKMGGGTPGGTGAPQPGAGRRLLLPAGDAAPGLRADILAASDIAVLPDASAPGRSCLDALDCMAHGLATIIADRQLGEELPGTAAIRLSGGADASGLAAALESLAEDASERARLGREALRHVRENHAPARVALHLRDAVERLHETSQASRLARLTRRISSISAPVGEGDVLEIIDCIAASRARERGPRQILLDISELVQRDAKTGIQRVVRALLSNLMASPPAGYRIEPVFFDAQRRMRYARAFGSRFVGRQLRSLEDRQVDLFPGDVFIGLDLQIDIAVPRAEIHRRMRARGVAIHYVVYDLLPAQHPEWFVGDVPMVSWLQTLASVSDGIVCISRTVGTELEEWLPRLGVKRNLPLHIGHFHLGDDLDGVEEAAAEAPLPFPATEPSFLMVGTVEIRKGHEQALAAFERLWADGVDAHLVIAGKPGWKVERLIERMRGHPEAGRRLHWFEKASDTLLTTFYKRCSALLAASRGEGFGLPLIEAAKYAQPILARDLPVFREIAGRHATYFSGEDPAVLADTIRSWMEAKQAGAVPSTADMPRLNWAQSAQALMDAVLGGRWDSKWLPDGSVIPAGQAEDPEGRRSKDGETGEKQIRTVA